jgi:uncharacterized protein (UPF0147 family)
MNDSTLPIERRLVSTEQTFTLRELIDQARQVAARMDTVANILEGVARDERVPKEVRENGITLSQPYSTVRPEHGA